MKINEAIVLYLFLKDQVSRNPIEERLYREAWRLIASEARIAEIRIQQRRS